MIRIDKNESPYRALTEDEISKIAVDTHFNHYANDEYQQLQKSYAAYNNLDPNLVSFANGSDEWIQKAMIILGTGPALVLDPDFVMYEEYAMQFKRPLVKISAQPDMTFDYEEVFRKIKEYRPSIFIFSQPNNPFGMMHPFDFVEKAAELMKEVNGYIIIDEAYAEFLDEIPNYPEGDHIIRFRTLSKVYGLAGLRIGVAFSTENTMKVLNSIAHPYPLNTFSLNIANYLLNRPERLTDFIDLNRKLARQLHQLFKEEVGDVINILESHTNFLFTYGEKAVELGSFVQQNGFRPRMYPESNQPTLKEAVRYSIATAEQMDELRKIVRKWRASQ
ncbi:MAG: histidinol-phosphate transaminase [Alkalibacterium sp.]|uniref:aminotransferase class I/II-fold pyridoxal phosphate-dependent enzyme n=1 Tax=Alkalibacterium sp. TaxID=1872447 RepID=UPI003970D344